MHTIIAPFRQNLENLNIFIFPLLVVSQVLHNQTPHRPENLYITVYHYYNHVQSFNASLDLSRKILILPNENTADNSNLFSGSTSQSPISGI